MHGKARERNSGKLIFGEFYPFGTTMRRPLDRAAPQGIADDGVAGGVDGVSDGKKIVSGWLVSSTILDFLMLPLLGIQLMDTWRHMAAAALLNIKII